MFQQIEREGGMARSFTSGAFAAAIADVGPALVLSGFGAVMFLSTGNTLIQAAVEDRIRARLGG